MQGILELQKTRSNTATLCRHMHTRLKHESLSVCSRQTTNY